MCMRGKDLQLGFRTDPLFDLSDLSNLSYKPNPNYTFGLTP